MERDKKKFKAADIDNDGKLTKLGRYIYIISFKTILKDILIIFFKRVYWFPTPRRVDSNAWNRHNCKLIN